MMVANPKTDFWTIREYFSFSLRSQKSRNTDDESEALLPQYADVMWPPQIAPGLIVHIRKSFLEKSKVEANIYLDTGAEHCLANRQLAVADAVAKDLLYHLDFDL